MVEGLTVEEFYLNENSAVFEAEIAQQSQEGERAATLHQLPPKAAQGQKPATPLSPADRWEQYEKMTDERNSATASTGRNGRLLVLAQLAHDHGENEADILNYCGQYVEPGFDLKEIQRTVKSATARTKNDNSALIPWLITKPKENGKRANQAHQARTQPTKKEVRKRRKIGV